MSYQVVEIRLNGGREKVLVQDRVPLYYPNLLVTHKFRNRSPNTQDKLLRHIALFHEFLDSLSIDLISRLEQRPKSAYLTDSEISRFMVDAHLSKITLDKKHAGVSLLEKAYEFVGSAHAEQRCETVRDYLDFLYERLGDEVTREDAARDLKKRFNRKIKSARPAWKRTRNDEIKGLTKEQRESLLEVAHPESNANPFTTGAHKYRNYIIVLLGLELGLRRSEMLLIKLSDIMWHINQIAIVGLEDESIDPRKTGPRPKTNERMLPIPDELARAIQKYVDTYRRTEASASDANNHPFLLVAHHRNEGQPMSIKAVDGLFNRLGETVPKLAGIHSHRLRHDAVFTLLRSMKEDLGALTPEDRTTQTQKVLTYAFGWRSNSEMPGLYGAKYWKEEADKAVKKRSENFQRIREEVEDVFNKRDKQ
ncbi:site-specific integrase [Halopseudomonas aestusnigri]|uniref:Phage integrase family protein n=1 Tax=Halopseudomonas aestusnigri TaxID=857252 RepID=A0AAQ1GAD0_9GAMM|nr:site-specific integrase [Halopseudomonas aestusnigri]OWL84021.1 integrase [Halopseudomonas aestusnigri]SEG72302.1 Phage integrase family protein [Halopseudomonas aestusnigri]